MGLHIAIYCPEMENLGGGEKTLLSLAEHLSHDHSVRLVARHKLDLPALGRYFNLRLGDVGAVVLERESGRSTVSSTSPFRSLAKAVGQVKRYKQMKKQMKGLKLDVFINCDYGSNLPSPAPLGTYYCMFPQRLESSYRGLVGYLDRRAKRRGIDSYQLILTNSRFTRDWIRTYWNRDSEVIYAVVEGMGSSPQKDKVVLNVGRFLALEDRSWLKRQEILVDVFGDMTAAHEAGWELHLVGSVAPDPLSLRMADELRASAEDLPIHLHFNLDFANLRQLYRRASIYWHATGYGKDPISHPDKQEHFGITTVEAMSAGTVPVVINTAGQRESVQHGSNGFLWNDLAELKSLTYRLMNDPETWGRLSREAEIASSHFSNEAFLDRFDSAFARLTGAR